MMEMRYDGLNPSKAGMMFQATTFWKTCRRLGFFALLVSMALPAWSESAKISAGTISGYVRDRSGVPQMGAAVEVLGFAARKVFTNDHGFYSISAVVPGSYNIKVSAPSFLPTLRERI